MYVIVLSGFIATLPMDTINPLYKTINREFAVKRWLGSDAGQIEWNKKEAAYLSQIVKALDEQGIKLLVGSDAGVMYMPAGASTHREIELLVEAGVPPLTVLQAATINAAQALGVANDYGSVAVGKAADLVIINANPLQELHALSQPRAVVKAGQWVSRKELQALKESAKNPSSFYISFGRLLQDVLSRAFG